MKCEERLAHLRLVAWDWAPVQPKPMRRIPKWNLEQVELLYVVGVGDGEIYKKLKKWLSKNEERQLVFFEEDQGAIASLLHRDHPLLHDERVELVYFPKEGRKEIYKEMAERYPVRFMDVVSLENQNVRAMRLELLRKTTLSHALFQDRLYGYQHFENFVRNASHFKGGFYANAFKGAFSKMAAIVCGAGPSLEHAIPILKKMGGRAIIIAGGSTIAALSQAGVEPHFAVAIDPNLEEFHRFQKSSAFECPLLFSTRVHHAIFSTCNGPFGYLRAGIGGAPELWLEEELGLTDPLIGERLPEESISVTSICLAFAQHLGCSTILLAGLDLAYTNGKRYAGKIIKEESIAQTSSAPDRLLRRKDKQGRFVQTAVRWVMEAAGISRYAKAHPEIRWINTTEGGLPIAGIQNISLQNAVQEHCTTIADLRGTILRLIAQNPMPDPFKKLDELKFSLERVVSLLKILTGESKGSKALAEYDLKEELASSILFYDIDQVLYKFKITDRWLVYLNIASKYLSRFI